MEVSDEIVEAFLLDKRAEAARDRKMFRYKLSTYITLLTRAAKAHPLAQRTKRPGKSL